MPAFCRSITKKTPFCCYRNFNINYLLPFKTGKLIANASVMNHQGSKYDCHCVIQDEQKMFTQLGVDFCRS